MYNFYSVLHLLVITCGNFIALNNDINVKKKKKSVKYTNRLGSLKLQQLFFFFLSFQCKNSLRKTPLNIRFVVAKSLKTIQINSLLKNSQAQGPGIKSVHKYLPKICSFKQAYNCSELMYSLHVLGLYLANRS